MDDFERIYAEYYDQVYGYCLRCFIKEIYIKNKKRRNLWNTNSLGSC